MCLFIIISSCSLSSFSNSSKRLYPSLNLLLSILNLISISEFSLVSSETLSSDVDRRCFNFFFSDTKLSIYLSKLLTRPCHSSSDTAALSYCSSFLFSFLISSSYWVRDSSLNLSVFETSHSRSSSSCIAFLSLISYCIYWLIWSFCSRYWFSFSTSLANYY